MNHLAEINNIRLFEANFCQVTHLEFGVMGASKISDVIVTFDAVNYKLYVVYISVIGHVKMAAVAWSKFPNSTVSIDAD